MPKRLHALSAFILAISVVISGCGGYGSSSSTSTQAQQISVAVSPASASIGGGQTQQFSALVQGSSNQSVAWSITPNTAGTISASGLYTAPGTVTSSQAVTVTAVVSAYTSAQSSATVTLVPTTASVSASAAIRFLEQSSFGPNPTLQTQVQQSGFVPFLTSQFGVPASTYPDPDITVNTLTPTQQIFFTNALTGQDQLRQRVAFALSEIWVTSGNIIPPQGMAPYIRLLSQDAFSNYRTIMQDVTLSPAMGRYLDMVNNDKPDPVANTHANENYARELMQLFTLGLYVLNADGSLQLDTNGKPIPTYDQNVVQAFARAYTGWTYPTQPGHTLATHNPPYWLGPMEALDSNHDRQAKTLLGGATLPAGQTSLQDLSGALDDIFHHPNIGPFVVKQLIQHLVTSNPSGPYVRRVADVFASGTYSGIGSGQRGDMQAVIAAILLDPEARRGDVVANAAATDGHLREPILFIANLLRAFGATSDGLGPINFASSLTEPPLRSPSVFNFFPPDYQIPGTMLLGPEYNLQTTATSLGRINFVNAFVFGSIGGGTTVDLTPYATLAGADVSALVDSLNTLLLHGTLSASARASVVAAVNAVPSGPTQNLTRARTAIYLIASSSQYQIQH